MNKLPQEIIDNIVFFLPDGPERERVQRESIPYRAPYATISNSFCRAVERGTFESIVINSDDLQTFENYFSPSRQVALRALFFDVTLPALTLYKPDVLNDPQRLKPPARYSAGM